MKEQWKVNEIIELGHYPQSGAGTQEPIEWKILKIEGERAFVTSRFALDAQPFDAETGQDTEERPDESIEEDADGFKVMSLANMIPSGFQDVTWEGCSLRNWLNQHFCKAAFSDEEQRCLMEVDELQDKVSLLALDENINDARLFPSDASTGCIATPYAASLYVDDIENDRQERAVKPIPPRASYWLKNKGMVIHGDEMEGVLGVVCGRFDLAGKLAVRPVLMVNLTEYERLLSNDGRKGSVIRRVFNTKKPIHHRFEEEHKITIKMTKNGQMITLNCDELGIHLTMKDPGEQAAQAIAINLFNAIGGDARTQFSFGELCWGSGGYCQADYHEAVRWYRYAANQGHADAMVNLAEAYSEGKGVEQNINRAFNYSLQAANHNHPLGMLNAGKCYENGWGTEKNVDEALNWYTKAADLGIAEAAYLKEALSRQF